MDNTDFIVSAYAVTFGLILWLILSTWRGARRVNQLLKQQSDR